MSGDPQRDEKSDAAQERPRVPSSPFGVDGAQFWAQHTTAANNTSANRDRGQKAAHNGEHGGHDHGGHAHAGEHTDTTIVTPGVTPGVAANPAAGTGGAGTGAGTAPAGPTAADTTAWLAAGASWITGTLLTAMAAEPEGTIGRNTALYCQGNAVDTGRPRVVLEAIVPMHDTDAQVTASGQDPTQYKAWAWGSTAAANISINVNGLGGYHSGNRIGLVTRRDLAGSTFTQATVRTFLIHEVQHDADHSESSREGAGEGSGFDDGAWRWFKTEYRSYWLDSRYDALSTTKQHTATHAGINGGAVINGKNEKSFACIKHLWDSGTAYQGIINAYNGNQRFKDLVHAHNGVDSANATNDPKVDDFVRSITSHDSSSAVLAWTAMDDAQRASCRNNGEIERLIQSVWKITEPGRVPLLGFVRFHFNEDDFREAMRFMLAIYAGDEESMRTEAASLGRARDWFLRSSDFRDFAEHHSQYPNNNMAFCIGWNGSDIIQLLNGSRPRGDYPINPQLAGCFAAGTPVLMADGTSRAIETLAVGDEVLAYDETARRVVGRRVLQCHDHAADATFRARIAGLREDLVVTAQHRFYVAGRGEWVRLAELEVGTELFHFDAALREASPRRLEHVEPAENVPVYNLSVEEHPSYFVAGVLVHNTKIA